MHRFFSFAFMSLTQILTKWNAKERGKKQIIKKEIMVFYIFLLLEYSYKTIKKIFLKKEIKNNLFSLYLNSNIFNFS